jgi:ubiquinone/menaquinone biosynthesis C-methylase UbiE
LASQGYTVHAVDPVSRHIQQAKERAAEHGVELASAAVADARRVDLPSGSADAVLLMGPLYHLQQRSDRLLALTEARRMLRPGGFVAAAAVSRFAAALDGLDRSFIDDPEFAEILSETLESGRHTNPTDDLRYFTTAYFHHPAELGGELEKAGFTSVDVQAVEGIAWLAPDFCERLAKMDRRGELFNLTDRLAREPSLLGVSPHLLAIGRAP